MTAAGCATPTTRATSVSGAAGSSGTATRPAATIATSAVAYSTGSVNRTTIRAPRGRVQPSFNVGDGVEEPGVAQRRRPPRVGQVEVGAVRGRRPLDPIAYQG